MPAKQEKRVAAAAQVLPSAAGAAAGPSAQPAQEKGRCSEGPHDCAGDDDPAEEFASGSSGDEDLDSDGLSSGKH
jgi:hypothetical protein